MNRYLYRKLYLELIAEIRPAMPNIRRVYPMLPVYLRRYWRVQLGCLWAIADEFGGQHD